jgi:hypothetical protein
LNNLTVPDDFDNAAVAILNVVDFPAPFGPSRPNIYPFFTENELFLIARYPFG